MDLQETTAQFSFRMLEGKIDSQILISLQNMNIDKPTLIQAKVIPYMLLGEDIIGAAKTGSGKTLSFLIPVIEKLITLGFTRSNGKYTCTFFYFFLLSIKELHFNVLYFRNWLFHNITNKRVSSSNL